MKISPKMGIEPCIDENVEDGDFYGDVNEKLIHEEWQLARAAGIIEASKNT